MDTLLISLGVILYLFVALGVFFFVGRQLQRETTRAARELREEVSGAMRNLGELVARQVSVSADGQMRLLETFADEMRRQMEATRGQVEAKLLLIQADNARQLEEMRKTVDEKLHVTLENRLGESFRQVSERLERVHQGLGEMQSLAQGVGDLKKVLSNVKTRGTWGEVQLGTILEEVLAPGQYEKNFSPREGKEKVEYAIRLPGQGGEGDKPIYMPIDAKFPLEDYERLLKAEERGDTVLMEQAGKNLEKRVVDCAKEISEKYLVPPHTTDFGILYLPVEGLFAEVVRRWGLTEKIQRDYRVVVAGPTTLWALLTSLQMGFRTLAIEKKSSEVWRILAEVKKEWENYGNLLDEVQRKLTAASDSIDKARRKTQVIEQKLNRLEELPSTDAARVIELSPKGVKEASPP